MKRKYLINSIVSISAAVLTALTACSPALSDRDPYGDDDRTGVVTSAADLVRVLNAEMNGIVAFPQEIAGSDCEGFCGAINSVSNIYGTEYTDQQGSLFSINENHYVEAPKDEDEYYYYNSEENMLVWFMINNNNAGRPEDELIYSFPMTLSGTFILTASGSVNTSSHYAISGQYAGLTMGFVDKVKDGYETQQNGGILVKAVENGTNDYIILQLPDVSTALETEMGFINVPYGNTNLFNRDEPFTISVEVASDATSSRGPTVRIRCNGQVLLPVGQSASFNGSTYASYVTNSVVWGLIAISLGSNPGPKVWNMLWSGGTLLSNPVPGCVSAASGNIVLACDLGLGGTAGTSSASSSQLLGMSINYQGPIASDY